jgi:hypothetical protein
MLKSHWAVLGRLRNVGITLAKVVGQYHARGVVPAPEADTPALRHDRRQGPMGWDGYHAGASVAVRGLASRGASDRESDLLVSAVANAPDAPQCGNREICKLSVFSASLICLLSWEDLLGDSDLTSM